MRLAIIIAAGIAITVGGVAAAQRTGASDAANRILVAPSSDPSLTTTLNRARIGERSVVTVATEPGVRRVTFYVDDPRVTRPRAVRTRAPFSISRGSKAWAVALSPGRHLMVAKVVMKDRTSRTLRAAYTVVRLYLSPSGVDSNPCSQTARCRSLERGYAYAPPGGIVELAEGAYGCDPIDGDRKTAVALRGADGAFPQIGCSLRVSAPWLRLERVNVNGTISFEPGADHSSFGSGTAHQFNIFGADDVTISSSTFDGGGQISNNQIWDEPAGSTPDRFSILGNTIRNFYGPTESSHSEGIYVGFSTDGLIAGNTFENNGTTAHLFFTWFGGESDPSRSLPRDICVRGNKFGATHGAYWAVDIRQEITPAAGIRIAPPPPTPSRGISG